MAFPGNVTKYVLSGSFGNGEIWSTGFYGEPLGPGVTMQSVADAFSTRPWTASSAEWPGLRMRLWPLANEALGMPASSVALASK